MELSVETLRCKSCGAALEARDDSPTVQCEKCGEQMPAASQPIPWEKEHSPIASLVRLYCRAMIVLILYVLSTGPMYWLIFAGYQASGSSIIANLYFPIVWACQQSDVICNWFDWYVGLWVY